MALPSVGGLVGNRRTAPSTDANTDTRMGGRLPLSLRAVLMIVLSTYKGRDNRRTGRYHPCIRAVSVDGQIALESGLSQAYTEEG